MEQSKQGKPIIQNTENADHSDGTNYPPSSSYDIIINVITLLVEQDGENRKRKRMYKRLGMLPQLYKITIKVKEGKSGREKVDEE